MSSERDKPDEEELREAIDIFFAGYVASVLEESEMIQRLQDLLAQKLRKEGQKEEEITRMIQALNLDKAREGSIDV